MFPTNRACQAYLCTRVHTCELCVCVCLRKYAASIQSALKINRRVNKQDGERESVHVFAGRERGGGGCGVKENVLSPLFFCLQRENRTL